MVRLPFNFPSMRKVPSREISDMLLAELKEMEKEEKKETKRKKKK